MLSPDKLYSTAKEDLEKLSTEYNNLNKIIQLFTDAINNATQFASTNSAIKTEIEAIKVDINTLNAQLALVSAQKDKAQAKVDELSPNATTRMKDALAKITPQNNDLDSSSTPKP